MSAFRDTTGRPGPATWELGSYPEGQADHPVGGVSWYEAAAYAAFAGKRLPTAFHWYNAAGLGNYSDILVASNKRTRDFTQETPVSDEIFDVIRRMYAYDRRPLRESVEAVEETEAWRKETVSFDDEVAGQRMHAYLFLPRNASPPFQTVIHFPRGEARMRQSSRELRLRFVEFVIRSGRALLFPIYDGTFERNVSVVRGPNASRDQTILWSKELGRSIDYLETRGDIDRGRIAFYGQSMGAVVGPILTALEPRFKASILFGGGVYEVRQPPEIEPVNFAPRVGVPTLMVSGKQDFARPVETQQRPLFNLLGSPPGQKRFAQFEGGHLPRMQDVICEILDWLDLYLGPVTPA